MAARHIPPLDGLRGIAILLVMLLHFTPEGDHHHLPGRIYYAITRAGWCGVDLFFVLSGFLITGILCDSRESQYYYRNFYMRRILRIFPLYYATIIFFYIFQLLFTAEGLPEEFRSYQIWLWFYSPNIPMSLQGKYIFFSPHLDLCHFWSLAIEEHFYLIWPIIVMAAGRKPLMGICLACVAFSLLLRMWFVQIGGYDLALPFFTPCRMDGLALGALVAILARGPHGLAPCVPYAQFGLALTAAMMIAAYACLGNAVGSHPIMIVGYTVVDLFFACAVLIAVVAPPSGYLYALLSCSFLRFFGKYSYGLYVFHFLFHKIYDSLFPVVSLSEFAGSYFAGVLLHVLFATGATVLLALASWNLLEKHCLKLKHNFEVQAIGGNGNSSR